MGEWYDLLLKEHTRKMPYDTPVQDPEVVEVTQFEVEPTPTVVEPPTAAQMTAFLVAIRRIAPGSARRVVEIIDAFLLHYYPDGIPEPPPDPAIETVTSTLLASDIMGQLPFGFGVVYPAATERAEFISSEIAFTPGTIAFDAAAGAFSVHTPDPAGPAVAVDVPGTGLIDGLVAANATMTAVPSPGNLGAPGAALKLTYLPAPTLGDGSVVITTSFRKWPEGTAPAASAASLPPFKFGFA
jgi:hypothetical protein